MEDDESTQAEGQSSAHVPAGTQAAVQAGADYPWNHAARLDRLAGLDSRLDELSSQLSGVHVPTHYSQGWLDQYYGYHHGIAREMEHLRRLETEHHRRLRDHLDFHDALSKHHANGERLRALHSQLYNQGSLSNRVFTLSNCKGSDYFGHPLFPGVLHIMKDGGCEIAWDQGWQNVERYFNGAGGKKKAETLIKFMELVD